MSLLEHLIKSRETGYNLQENLKETPKEKF